MSSKISVDLIVEKFWEAVPKAWHRTREVIRDAAAEKFHLTVEQFQVLRRIRRGIASVSAIATDSRTSRSAVSKAVDALVNRGLVSRRRDPNDRRNIPLELTKDGNRALSAIYSEAEAWLSGRFDLLTDSERTTLNKGLDQLNDVFSRD
jgi:DNA-binding MarR family transcriptional regulator